VTLAGAAVRLEPLALGHVDALTAVACDEELWRWTTSRLASSNDVEVYVRAGWTTRSLLMTREPALFW
jgi:hypothetical protein